MRAIHGGKAKNDKIDSHKIAVLLRGGSFPLAYAYPQKMRATRDLLRRRNHLTHKRSELLAHIQNTASQYNLPEPLGRIAKPSERGDLLKKFPDPVVRRMVEVDVLTIEHYEHLLDRLERELEKMATQHDPVKLALLKSIPGAGKILGMVMLYEIKDIGGFPREQDFASYCQLVKAAKESNGKTTGFREKNRQRLSALGLRRGNRTHAQRQPTRSERAAKTGQQTWQGQGLAILSHRLGRAVYLHA